MNTRLNGHNILLIERSRSEAMRVSEYLSELGASVFVAIDQVQAVDLQHRWDFDIIICEVSFLSGLGGILVDKNLARSTPLLFAYGPSDSVLPKLLARKGVLKSFNAPLDCQSTVNEIANFLYNTKEHVTQLVESNKEQKISFNLRISHSQWELEINEFLDDGLVTLTYDQITEQIALLVVSIPNQKVVRFSVRVERSSECTRLKISAHDSRRWKKILFMVEARQLQINKFLIASSGK